MVRRGTRVPLWLTTVFSILLLLGFLVWASAGANLPIPGLLAGSLGLAVPLIFGALGGVISERVGVVNIAIEGQLLAGAFSSALVASVTGSPIIGLVAARWLIR
jgi:simple sugar transport system permease protein